MFNDLLGGLTKLEAFQCYFVTKFYPPQTVTFSSKLKDDEQDKPASKQISLIGGIP
jgi:hypothetical protein